MQPKRQCIIVIAEVGISLVVCGTFIVAFTPEFARWTLLMEELRVLSDDLRAFC